MNRSFYGYNVIGNGASLRPHLLRLQPTSVFYMDAWGEANWAAQNLPNTVVIHRVFKPEEDTMHRTPGRVRAHLQERASEGGDSRVYRNLGTEPHIADDNDLRRLVDEYLLALQWAKSVGLRVAAPHFAHYGLDERHWPIVEPLTSFIASNPDMALFTCDEYAAGHSFSGVLHPGLPGGNEVGHIQPETWRASPVPHYYHVGRITNLFRWLKANGKPLPRTVITEAGMDALGDVTSWRNSLIKSPGYSDIRGWLSLTEQWKQWYGSRGWSPERAYVEMLVAAWREIYKPWPNILGACLYCWGTNNDRQWDQFRLDGATEFQSRLEATAFDLGGTPPVTSIPKPTTPPVEATLIRVPLTFVNVRAQPNSASADVGDLYPNTRVRYYPDSITNQFVYIETVDKTPAIEGWVSLQNGAVVFEVVNPDAPVFVLGNPVAFQWRYSDKFNAPRNYSAIAPTKLQKHEGVDVIPLAGEQGPYTVIAAQTGVVESVGNDDDGYGQYVRLRHDWYGQTYKTWYAHLKTGSVVVKTGDTVTIGATLGEMGATGYVSGPHLHFTLQHIGHGLSNYVVDDVIDPEPVLPAPPTVGEPPVEEPPVEEPPPVETPDTVLAELQAAMLEWGRRDRLARAAFEDATAARMRFEQLLNDYLTLTGGESVVNLTLVKDTQGEAA